MSRDDLEKLQSGVYKRKSKRRLGLFIDGVGLDRATRRLERKVDLARLVAGLCSGLKPEIARYYTLIPHEDDARQFSFLDAVERAGLKVIVKRLPPKGVKRQVSMDVHMASDIIAYCSGFFDDFQETDGQKIEANGSSNGHLPHTNGVHAGETTNGVSGEIHLPTPAAVLQATTKPQSIKRLATIVCPNRELSYAIDMAHRVGVETSLADFGLYGSSDGWKGVDRWVDLSTSETIWRG